MGRWIGTDRDLLCHRDRSRRGSQTGAVPPRRRIADAGRCQPDTLYGIDAPLTGRETVDHKRRLFLLRVSIAKMPCRIGGEAVVDFDPPGGEDGKSRETNR